MSSRTGSDAIPDFETWWTSGADEETLRRAYFYTRQPALAEDIAQEAAIKFYKAWPHPDTRNEILNKPAYRNTVIRNCYLDHIKVRSRTNLDEAELNVDWHGQEGQEEHDHDLRLAVLLLEDAEQEMIILHYYEDLTIKQAGIQLGLSPARSYRLHDKAIARLGELLKEGKG